MNLPDDFIKRLEEHEESGKPLTAEELQWLEELKAASKAGGELKLKEELETYYVTHKKQKRASVIRFTSLSIAASVVIGTVIFFNLGNEGSSPDTPLQMDNPPIFSDSATYDSVRNELPANDTLNIVDEKP